MDLVLWVGGLPAGNIPYLRFRNKRFEFEVLYHDDNRAALDMLVAPKADERVEVEVSAGSLIGNKGKDLDFEEWATYAGNVERAALEHVDDAGAQRLLVRIEFRMSDRDSADLLNKLNLLGYLDFIKR